MTEHAEQTGATVEVGHDPLTQEPASDLGNGAAPVILNDSMRQILAEQGFLTAALLSAQAAERSGLRLRLVPALYHFVKRSYSQWPGRAWSVNLADAHEARQVLDLIDQLFLAYSKHGFTRIQTLLGEVMKEAT